MVKAPLKLKKGKFYRDKNKQVREDLTKRTIRRVMVKALMSSFAFLLLMPYWAAWACVLPLATTSNRHQYTSKAGNQLASLGEKERERIPLKNEQFFCYYVILFTSELRHSVIPCCFQSVSLSPFLLFCSITIFLFFFTVSLSAQSANWAAVEVELLD